MHLTVKLILRYSYFGLLLTGLFCFPAKALPELKKDSSKVEIRSIPVDNLVVYKSDKNFQYTIQGASGMSVWDRFWRWFWFQAGELMERKGVRISMKILMYVLPVIILAYAILRFMGMEKVMLWISGQKSTNPAFDFTEDNIYGIDFSQEIEDAVAQGRYRDATRLNYLKALRTLSDTGRIKWNKNKTNIDYAHELGGSSFSHAFADITQIYEYAWYGEFQVTEQEYFRVKDHFNRFEKTVWA